LPGDLGGSGLGTSNFFLEPGRLFLMLRSANALNRSGVSSWLVAGQSSGFRDVVKEGEELVKLFLAHRVILVVMAASATQSQTDPGHPGRPPPPHHGFDPPFLTDDTPLTIEPMVPVEPRRHDLRTSRLGEHVAGDLLDGKAVEWHVVVEGLDHPV